MKVKLLLLLALPILIAGVVFFIVIFGQKNNLTEQIDNSGAKQTANKISAVTMEKNNQNPSGDNEIAEEFSQIDLLKNKLIGLINLENKIQAADIKNSSQMIELFDTYKNDFSEYVDETEKNGATIKSEELKSIRALEWQNYQNFTKIKDSLDKNAYIEEITDIQALLDIYLKSQSSKSVENIVPEKNKKTGKLQTIIAIVNNFLVPSAFALSDNKIVNGVIHKKVVLDFDDPGKSGKLQPCWSYESWVDMGNGNMRQEQNVSDNDCDSEIDITDGKTGKKLALDPKRKLAEWVISPKIGIGNESKKDPYLVYKENLDKEIYIISGTETFDGKNVYLLKKPIYNRDYEMVYLDAETYMPFRMLSYIEEVIIEPDPANNTKNKVTKTGKMINNFGIRFLAGEIIDRENLSIDHFNMKIPVGYQITDWVPFG